MVVEQRRGREGMRVSTQTDEELACNSFFIRVMEGDFFSLEIVFRVFFYLSFAFRNICSC